MLNKQQEEAKELIIDFIKNYSRGVFGLYGAGGVGKTYLITSLPNVEKYQFLAPTNKAVNILRKSLMNNGVFKPKVKTIDSFFSFKIKKNAKNITEYSYKQPREIADVIIVDEVSMLKNKHVDLLMNINKKVPIIFLGDSKQLPPIEGENEDFIDTDGFKKSKAFSVITYSYELTIQNRQKENSELFKLINGFRNNMGTKIDFKTVANIKNNTTDILYLHQESEELKEIISKEDCVAITFKNSVADLFNYKIGKTITNDKNYNINSINKGDEMVFNQFYKNEDVVFYTSEKVKIIELDVKEVEIKVPYRKKSIIYDLLVANVRNELGIDKIIWLPDPKLREKVYHIVYDLRKILTKDKELSELNTFYSDFMNSFARLKKPYALTTHKSQGSTYENVIIPIYDFYKKNYKDANQLFYVALSRASKRVIFVSGWCNFNNSFRRVNFTEEERCFTASSQEWKCNICNTNITDAKYEIDHINPLGSYNDRDELIGTNNINNLQALCKQCHKEKTYQS
jgi:exodeoxyribonuclease-5